MSDKIDRKNKDKVTRKVTLAIKEVEFVRGWLCGLLDLNSWNKLGIVIRKFILNRAKRTGHPNPTV
jgi:hypothetical protein